MQTGTKVLKEVQTLKEIFKEITSIPKFEILEKKQIGKIESLKVSAVFQEVDRRNKNNRIYPADLIAKEINRLQEKIKNRELMGELDHPEGQNIERIQYVKLSEVSHLITSLRIEGTKVYGEFETLNTPNGVILRSLIEHGISLGVSLRQIGSVTEKIINNEKVQVVNQDDFELITYDIVSEPSFQNQKIISITESKKVKALLEQQREILDSFPDLDKVERYVYEKFYFYLLKYLKKE